MTIPAGVAAGGVFSVQSPAEVPMAAPVGGAMDRVKIEDFLGGDGNNENDKLLPLSGFVLYEMPRLQVPQFKILGDHFNQVNCTISYIFKLLLYFTHCNLLDCAS